MIPPPFAGTEKREQKLNIDNCIGSTEQKYDKSQCGKKAFGLRLLSIERERERTVLGRGDRLRQYRTNTTPPHLSFSFV